MHIEARLFEFLTAFFALVTVVYGALTALYANGGIEWAGTTALVLTTGLTLLTGTFFRFVARRLDTRSVLHLHEPPLPAPNHQQRWGDVRQLDAWRPAHA